MFRMLAVLYTFFLYPNSFLNPFLPFGAPLYFTGGAVVVVLRDEARLFPWHTTIAKPL